jgi:hypothetical protein
VRAPRIGLLVIDGVTLAVITPVRARLETLGAQVVLLVPTGGSVLPVGGRYFPAAAGPGARLPLHAVRAGDIDALLLPDTVTRDTLARHADAIALLRGRTVSGPAQPVPVFTQQFLLTLLDHGARLAGLAQPPAALLGGKPGA